MSSAGLSAELSRLCPGGVRRDVPLAQLSRWRIGGSADIVVEPGSAKELSALRRFIAREGLASVVIGDSSNLLFSDDGLRAICIRIGARMSDVSLEGSLVHAQAGIWVPRLARRVQKAGLTGLEHTCGIPGTLGGLICMNGGSQRKGVGSAVISVTAVGPDGAIRTFDRDGCGFAYRQSVFQHNHAAVASVTLGLALARDAAAIRREMLSILRARSRKFPRKQPNCGSVFKSNPAMYAEIGPPGAAIERLGFKGYRIGDALISPQHANFFVNAGAARADDMVRLICEVGGAVHRATGYRMEPEVRLVTEDGSIEPIPGYAAT